MANLVEYDLGTWHATFAVSQNGILVYEPGSKALGADLVWMDGSGKVLSKVADRAFYKGSGKFSPDGKRLAISMGEPQADIWVLDLTRSTRTRLTFGGATYLAPSWSADGQRVVYVKQNGATLNTGTSLCARLANGGGQEEVLMKSDPAGSARTLLSPQWSPDGKYLVHMEQNGPGGGVWALPLAADTKTGEKKPLPVVQPQTPQARIVQFRLSPDGRWLAYSSTESGREEIYVTHFPSGAGRWQVSQTGGTFPVWRGDSSEILYIGTDGIFQAASVNAKSGEFEVGQVRALFRMNYTAPLGTPYDVAPDGQRYIFATYPESVSTPLVLVTNWTGDLTK
jgi:serine/threonine-protein kinase